VFVALVTLHSVRMRHIFVCGLSGSSKFFHISHQQHDIRKNVAGYKMRVLTFSTTFVWNISHSKKNRARYDQKYVLVLMWSTLYSSQILMKLEFSWHIFEKYSNIKFHENLSSDIRVVPCGQTDGHGEANSRFSQYFERA